MTKPKHYRGGKLRVSAEHVEAMDGALRGKISEGQRMIDSFRAEMESVQEAMDHPDATPEVVEKGKHAKNALYRLINVTAEIISQHQRALYNLERGPV